MTDFGKAAGWATIALGASQALVPSTAAKAFGLGPLDGQTLWLARILGVSNVMLGTMQLDADSRARYRSLTTGGITAEAVATTVAMARGHIPVRAGASVLGFLAGLVVADLRS